MTQHPSTADTLSDQRIMRQLAVVVGCFIVATAVLAVAVGLIMGYTRLAGKRSGGGVQATLAAILYLGGIKIMPAAEQLVLRHIVIHIVF